MLRELAQLLPKVAQSPHLDRVCVVHACVVRRGKRLRSSRRGLFPPSVSPLPTPAEDGALIARPLLEEGPCSASIIAVERSRLVLLSRAEFDALIEEYSGVALGIARVLSRRFQTMTAQAARR